METARLRAFIESAQNGSIKAAADALGYTPSAISQLVTALEKELGLTLFVRSQKGVTLTAEGTLLVPLVRSYLQREEEIYQFADELKGIVTGKVAIAAYPSVATTWLPEIVRKFKNDFPGIQISIMECIRSDIFHHFEQNEDGDLVVIELFKNNKLSNRIHISYDQLHRPIMFVNDKSFISADIFLQTDTNLYRYLDNDKYGNWTKLEIEYRSSFYPEQNHVVYSVLRQITYRGEREKEPLIKQSIVNDYMEKRNQFTIHELNPISLGIASISIPNYMVPSDTKNYLSQTNRHISLFDNDLCRYTYKDKSKYASFSIQYTPNKGIGLDEMTDEERVFNKEVDNEFRKQYENPEIQQDLALLIWYPYDFVNNNNHWALRQRYIRYGNGAWVPVYVESYLMDTPDGGAITITMSYQITHKQYFHQDFTNSVRSLRFL